MGKLRHMGSGGPCESMAKAGTSQASGSVFPSHCNPSRGPDPMLPAPRHPWSHPSANRRGAKSLRVTTSNVTQPQCGPQQFPARRVNKGDQAGLVLGEKSLVRTAPDTPAGPVLTRGTW